MKPEYDLTKMKSCPNPYAKKLKQQVNLPLEIAMLQDFDFDLFSKIFCQIF